MKMSASYEGRVGPLFKSTKPATSSKQELVYGVEEVAIRLVLK